jgi:hypothetical protein
MSGVSVNAATHTVTVSGSNVTLNGYDFSLNGGWGIDVVNGATNVTIQNSYFKVGTNNLIPVDAYYGGAVNLLYNTFDGGGSSGATASSMFRSGAGATMEYNRFTNVPNDAINVVNDGNFVIQYNLFDHLGFGDYHTDAIQSFFSPVASMVVQYNTMYQPASGGSMNAFVRIGDQRTDVVSNPVMAYNTLVFQNAGGSANVFQLYPGTAPGTLVNPTVHDNFIDPTKVLYAVVSPTFGSYTVNPTTYNNVNLTNGHAILNGPWNNQTANVPANPPAAPLITDQTAVNANQLKLMGTAPAGTTIDVYDQGALLGSTTASSSGTWSFTTGQLTGGTHAFTARAIDPYANASGASQIFGATGPNAPVIASFSTDSGTLADGITNDNTLTLSGTTAANITVKVFDGTMQIGTATANGSGAWTYTTATLGDGKHSFAVTDTSGTSTPLAVTVDGVAPDQPVVSSFSPDTASTGDGHTTATTLTLTGTGEANSTIKASDGTTLLGSAPVNASGVWSLTTSGLAVGTHTFTATDTDAAGNTSVASAPLTVTVDSGGDGSSNLVVNGGFETGNFSGWTVGSYQPEQILITSNAHSGKFATALGPAGSDGSLSENLATVAGQHYTLHFSLANMSSGANDFSVHWDGTSVFALVNAPSQNYTDYTFDVVAADNSTHLEFDFRQDPTQWRLDDVSVVATGTSEPPPPTDTSGNDVLKGTSGADLLAGGAGDDTYTVNATGDKVIELANNGSDNVETTISYTLPSNVENLQLTGGGAINGAGNDLNNIINGNDASNLLEGNAGNDTLNGRYGEDTLSGGSGDDVFQFSSQFSADGDQVMDFVHDVDKLDFSKIDASTYRSGDQGFTFDGYSDGGRGRHLWAVEDQAAGVTHLYGQTGSFQFHIDLQGTHLGLTASDFIL